MDEHRYWSVRDACWLPSPRPLSLLETPWSLHARPCPRPQPCPTPEQDLRWLRLPPTRVPAQRSAEHDDAGRPTTASPATSAP